MNNQTPSGSASALRGSSLALLPPLILLASLVMPGAPRSQAALSTEEEMKVDLDAVPCKDSDRLNAVKSLFVKMGADASDLSIASYKSVQNLVVIKRGTSDEKIVVGAHYDKVSRGCGAIDNWTGIVALAHIYKTLKQVKPAKTLVFIAFGKEEESLMGSHAMVEAIPKEELPLYCAMVNIDSLGMSSAQVADNMSTRKLEELAAGLAKKMSMNYGHASIPEGLSDSNSFLARKIPALTIHGMSDKWRTTLHTAQDQASKVNSTSVYLGYRLALAVVSSIDGAGCDSFR